MEDCETGAGQRALLPCCSLAAPLSRPLRFCSLLHLRRPLPPLQCHPSAGQHERLLRSRPRRRTIHTALGARTLSETTASRPLAPQSLINDKGYAFLDIRTGAEYRSGNGLHWCAR